MAFELIGRDVELGRLAQLASAAAAGPGSLVFVSGEAGVGKTALARTALKAAGLAAIEVAATETAARPYAPITAILRSGVRSRTLKPRERPAVFRNLGALLPELEQPPSDEARDQQLIFEAVAAALTEMSAHRPLGILVDDVHWADAATLDTLAFLAEVVHRMPVLLVVSYRNDDVRRGHPVRRMRSELRRKGLLHEIALEPLDAPDTGHLFEQRLGRKPSPQLAALIHDRTEGLPFFIEEVAAALAENAALRAGPRGLEFDSKVALPMPESVRDAVLQRVDRFPAELRDALAVAAVAGREFDSSVLSIALHEDMVASLPSTALLVESAPGRLAFRHALIRDALYDAIPWGRRRSLHRKLAERLEACSAAPQTIAAHWTAAGDAAPARAWLVAAAGASHAASAYRDAATELNRALDLWPADVDAAGRLDALEFLARNAELGGTAALGVKALTEAIELLDAGTDRRRYADAERRLAALLELEGAWERALVARQLAAAAFAAAGYPADAAIERLASAARLRSAASFKAALELIHVGKGEAEAAGRPDLGLRFLALEGNVKTRAGEAGVGLPIVRAALAQALATSDFGVAAEAYQRLADSLEHSGDYSAARASYFEAAAFCRANGAATVGDVCLACLTMVLRQTGEWDRAVELSHEVLASPTSNLHAQAVAHGVLGSILAHRGRQSQAQPELHNSNVLARRIGLAAMEMDSDTNLARLAAAAGRTDEAQERCWRMVRTWERTDSERHYSIPNLRWITSFASESGATDLQRASTAALVTIASQPDFEAQAAASSALGEGLLTEGETGAAVVRFEQAVKILADLDLPFERAEVEWRAAAAQVLAGHRTAAMHSYRSAYRAAIRLGARPMANRIAGQVAALGENVERRLGSLAASGLGRGGLSPRELEVARLVASGLTSREAATKLSLSPRTVEMHVHRILNKLDCRTRVDITRRAAALGLLD
ncbi:MAG TPA: AAA family ATPase [Candidatus Limnocylindria bacterium]|nr:AAA family ATPase [Candidatus Limnocylindria bacterium]